MQQPFFMAIEGTDKSGKTSVAAKVMQQLLNRDIPVTLVQEPGSTRVGERVRKTIQEIRDLQPLTEAFLFEAARHEMMQTRVRPALEKGTNVISIRFTTSTTVYQGHAGGADVDTLRALNVLATAGLEADHTVILDVPIEEARARGQADDGFESKADTFYQKVRTGYLHEAALRPEQTSVVDATNDQETVVSAVLEIALRLTGRGNGS